MTWIRGKRARELRGLGHGLNPAVSIGKAGITSSICAELDRMFGLTPLLKVRLVGVEGTERKELAEEVAAAARADIVQLIGKMLLLFKRDEPKVADESQGEA
jgi:RNA-binding protein